MERVKKTNKSGTKRSLGVLVQIFLVLILFIGFVSADSGMLTKEPPLEILGEPTFGTQHWLGCDSYSNACELEFGVPHNNEDFTVEETWYYYYVETSIQGKLTFELQDVDTDDLELRIRDGDRNKMCEDLGSGDKKCSFYKTEPGTERYYILIWTTDLGWNRIAYADIISEGTCTSNFDYFCSGEEIMRTGQDSNCNWISNQFVEDCDNYDYDSGWSSTQCINGKLRQTKTIKDYSCGGSYCDYDQSTDEKIIDYCDGMGCSTSTDKCYECKYDYHCSSGEKCSSGYCIDKVCSDYSGTSGTCSGWDYTFDDKDCLGGSSGNPAECVKKENIYCWDEYDSCDSEQYCDSGVNWANCVDYECEFESVSWDETNAYVGENVGITVSGDHCQSDDGTILFEVLEDDDLSFDDPVNSQPPSKTFSSNQAKTSWTAEYMDDDFGNPEYDVYAIFDGTRHRSSNQLRVSCPDLDGDGFSSYGGVCGPKDCNDNNENRYPGAPETCNDHDDDCDNDIDEDFDFDYDENNCGWCGRSCPGGYQCYQKDCLGCGDGICSSEIFENPATCSKDCFGDLQITDIVSAPSEVMEGEFMTVRVKLENKGTYVETLDVEVGIAPESWEGTVFSGSGILGTTSAMSVTKCCPENDYYDAKRVTLGPKSSETVTFVMSAPNPSSVDACSLSKNSAWDKNHKIVAGIYERCGSGYVDEMTQEIKVYQRCWKDSDCAYKGDEFCNFNTGFPGKCTIGCLDECPVENSYVCDGSDEIEKCGDYDVDPCLELKHISYCPDGTQCVPGKSSCQVVPLKTEVSIDYAMPGIKVNKQYGDIVKLNLDYKGSESVTLDYNMDLFDLIDCSDSFTMTSDKICKLQVIRRLAGSYSIGVKNGEKEIVEIINNPKTIMVTDREKMIERYGDIDEVDAILAEAYETADKEDGIIYDVGDYLDSQPWDSLSEYDGGDYAVR